MVMPLGFSVRRLMRLLRKSLALITPPGLAGPAMSGVVVAGLGVLSVWTAETLLLGAVAGASSSLGFTLGGGNKGADIFIGGGSSGDATEAALAAFALAITEAVEATGFGFGGGAETATGIGAVSQPIKE